jgi:chlorite dismutase
MSHGARPSGSGEVSLSPSDGWHCSHLFYRWDRAALKGLSASELAEGSKRFCTLLDPAGEHAPTRLQVSAVSGHKADVALMLLDADPLKVDGLHQRLLASPLGAALVPTWSFVSLTEVSEYVPTVEQYGKRLIEEGEDPSGPAYAAKLKAYAGREGMMREQRLRPEFPAWPNTCFYPMNKIRAPLANWFTLPQEERSRLMAEHGRTGMTFGGKVTQLITVGLGLDDWEWGVTLWARTPDFLRDIVYKMRFDLASAKYAEFGPFYMSYVMSPEAVLAHCQII